MNSPKLRDPCGPESRAEEICLEDSAAGEHEVD